MVVVENLNTKTMTKSAKGTVETPGRNVKQKAGLNREILKSNWGRLERYLSYKAGELVRVDPAYTSQTCAVCGHVGKENRSPQTEFKCTACGTPPTPTTTPPSTSWPGAAPGPDRPAG